MFKNHKTVYTLWPSNSMARLYQTIDIMREMLKLWLQGCLSESCVIMKCSKQAICPTITNWLMIWGYDRRCTTIKSYVLLRMLNYIENTPSILSERNQIKDGIIP